MSYPYQRSAYSLLLLLLVSVLALVSPASGQGMVKKWTDLRATLVPGAVESDQAKLAVDGRGNVYTVATSNDYRSKSWLVRKVDSAGTILWERRVTTASFTNLVVAGAAVDSEGNLFVTGSGYSTGLADFFTTKLSATNGATLWEKTYAGANNTDDFTTGITMDSAGNAIVIGMTGTLSNRDGRTIKYSGSNGTVLWERPHAGSGGYDSLVDVKCDASGNVVVTGSTSGNLYTGKYSGSNGAVLWEKSYNGPANGNDYGRALALDASGNALVTGASEGSSGTGYDVIVLKFAAANGTQAWERRINGAANGDDSGVHIACDAQANPIVFGYRQTTSGNTAKGFYLVKCSGSNGSIVWEKTETGPGYFEDDQTDRLIVDSQGNAIVTNNGYVNDMEVTVSAKYASSNGATLWRKTYTWETTSTNVSFQIRHGGMAIALDSAGAVIIAGISTAQTSDTDILTQKQDSATGNTIWMSRLNGGVNKDDRPASVVFDSAGDVVTAGFTEVGATTNVVIRKTNRTTGEATWENSFNAQADLYTDDAIGLDAGKNGDIFMACASNTTTQDTRLYLCKYSSAGTVTWEKRFQPAGGRYSRWVRMMTDAAGDIYLTGSIYLTVSGSSEGRFYLAKFSGTTGNAVWEKTYRDDSLTRPNSEPTAMTLTPTGDLLATGYASDSYPRQYFRTVKFSGANGTRLWAQGSTSSEVRGTPYDIASDAQGNAAITGMFINAQGQAVMYTAKYASATGAVLWEKTYTGVNTSASGAGVAMDSQGNVIATGKTRTTTNATYDWYTVKYAAADGAMLWQRPFTGAISGGNDYPQAVAVDSQGNPTVTGYTGTDTDTVNGYFSVITQKYSGVTGAVLGQDTYAAKIQRDEVPLFELRAITLAPDDAVAVTHRSVNPGPDSDVVTILFEPVRPKLVMEYPAGTPVVSNGTIDLGIVPPGGRGMVFDFTLRNTGGSVLNVGTMSFSGPEASLFRITSTPSPVINAGGSAILSIQPQSPVEGLHSATLLIPSNDPDTPEFRITLRFTTPSRNADLGSLSTAPEPLTPAFSTAVTDYHLTLPFSQSELRVTGTPADPTATLRVQGNPVASGSTVAVPVAVNTSVIMVRVVAQDVTVSRDYRIIVNRLPEKLVYNAASDVPFSVRGFVAKYDLPPIELNFAPIAGTSLLVVRNDDLDFIEGRFANLVQGQEVTLTFGGKSYRFVANYYGGNGNDLVLQWADTAMIGWGANESGQLGSGAGGKQPVLSAAPVTGGGSRTLAVSAGYLHSISLAPDGIVSTWGSNSFGQLGDGTKTARSVPQAVTMSGALAGKTVVAVAAGAFHSLALCSDGTVVSWGYNNHGQLGNGTTISSTVPVAVVANGALAGKHVTGIAAGAYHSLARCADGTVVAWGFNGTGALGNGTTTGSLVPVTVGFPGGTGSARVRSIAAGQYHSVALLENGYTFAWGYNDHGQVGDGSINNAVIPVVVALPSATVAIAAGGSHTLALLEDGKLMAWGSGASGQLGDGAQTDRLLPVTIPSGAGALASETIVSLSAGMTHSVAFLASGRIATWGENTSGQLGNASTQGSSIPVAVTLADDGSRAIFAVAGSSASHVLALAGLPVTGSGSSPVGVGSESPALTAWRLLHFDGTDGADGSDDADPDQDGLPNLVEYAFGSDPMDAGSVALPAPEKKDGYLVMEFTASGEELGVNFGASSTPALFPADWQQVADEGTGDLHLFRMPLAGASGFMRLEVTRR